jgi:hypothetical protein
MFCWVAALPRGCRAAIPPPYLYVAHNVRGTGFTLAADLVRLVRAPDEPGVGSRSF